MARNEIVEIDWMAAGAHLGCLSDEEQGAFFEGFARELCGPSYKSHFHRETQMLYVRDKIPAKWRVVLKEYLPCLWCDESDGEG